MSLHRTPRRLASAVLLAAALLSGCGSEDKKPSDSEPDVVVEEPITGTPGAPPLGAPRAKLTPRELTPDVEED